MGKTIRFNENGLIAIKERLNEVMVGIDDASHNDIVTLWHGTDIPGIVGILKSGTICARDGVQHGETYGMNWFSLKKVNNFNKGIVFSIEVPSSEFKTKFKMMNSSEAITRDDRFDISQYDLKIEMFCTFGREQLNRYYNIIVEKGEHYPIETIRDEVFYKWCEESGNEDVYMSTSDYDLGLILSNILGEDKVRAEGFLEENTNLNEAAPEVDEYTICGEEKDGENVAGGNYFHVAESIDFDNNGMSINDDKILGKYNLKDLILSKTGNYVTLNKIIANELGKGSGSRFMEELTRMADKNGWTLALTPDTSFGGSSVGRLKKFYKRFGFVPNKGRSTDFNTRESMIRKPCELKKNIIIPENRLITLKENLEPEVSSSEVDLSSFKKRDSLPPGIWKDEETLSSKVRLKLLDIADDFWEFVNLSWVEPKGIIITGSICNFNWSKFSDIDLHLIVDFSEIDSKTEFVKQYFDSKKNEWNTEHDGLKIMGFPVELYVQDINENPEAGGIYDLEENAWIRRPNPHTIKSIGLNKFNIKDKAAEIMTIIDDMYDTMSSTSDGHVLDQVGEDAHYLWDKVKDLRKKSLSKNGESGSGNIVYKVLRRTGYLDKLFKLFSTVYDRSNSITESMKNYLTVLKEEVAMDGSTEDNPYEERWKAERKALKDFVANYGKLMQSREDNKGGKLYKVYYDETMSKLIGYNYCICVQWNEQEMKPGTTVYIRALDKFTPFIRRNLQFDTRGRDNMRGTYDDTKY